MNRFAAIVAFAVAATSTSALALQGDEDPSDGAPKVAAPKAAPAPAPTDIIAVATAAGNLTTFLKAVADAGLTETLQGPGPFTVFAPTDAAFNKMNKKELNKLLGNKAKLKKVLTYHVISGNLSAADVGKLKEAKSVEGSELKIKAAKGKVTVNKASVVKADVAASNGVIHVIDGVLSPKS